MNRKFMSELNEWRLEHTRKPLVLRGARQVGKTWLLKQFGRTYFKYVAYFSFDRDEAPHFAFTDKNPKRIIEQLSLLSGTPIIEGKTLLILDEIQECPNALNALKYFCEEMPSLHVVAAGSLLGTFLSKPSAYPVGKVTIKDVTPMDFAEFVEAVAPTLYPIFSGDVKKLLQNLDVLHQKLLDLYHQYLLIGGMPEAVACWCSTHSLEKVQRIQDDLITFYEGDFGKYLNGLHAARVLMVFRNIVAQLAKENEKFIYSAIKAGGRAREFETAIEWAVSAGLFKRVCNLSKPECPHIAFERLDCFKLFFFDTGLLCRMARISAQQILECSDFQFKGPLTENYVLQQLSTKVEAPIHYYSPSERHELDFLLQFNGQSVPVEVKGGSQVSSRSLKNYIAKHSPNVAIRFSEKGLDVRAPLISLPLYLAPRLTDIIPTLLQN